MWLKIQHAWPLAHFIVSEFWLGYIPTSTDIGFGIDFEIIFLWMRVVIQHAGVLARLVHLAYFLFTSATIVS